MTADPSDRLRDFFDTETRLDPDAREEGPRYSEQWLGGPGIAEYFDRIYCVNLARRQDRWVGAQRQFSALGLEVERFEAVDGATLEGLPATVHLAQSQEAIPGVVGCSLSHRAVLEDAHTKGYERVLILEDDVVFAEDANRRFARIIGQVPPDWAMLYLGGNHRGGLRVVTPNVARTGGTYTTNCYAVRARTIDALLDVLPSDPTSVQAPVDVVYYSLHRKMPSYVLRPHLAWQRDGYSDVEQAHMEYGFLRG